MFFVNCFERCYIWKNDNDQPKDLQTFINIKMFKTIILEHAQNKY